MSWQGERIRVRLSEMKGSRRAADKSFASNMKSARHIRVQFRQRLGVECEQLVAHQTRAQGRRYHAVFSIGPIHYVSLAREPENMTARPSLFSGFSRTFYAAIWGIPLVDCLASVGAWMGEAVAAAGLRWAAGKVARMMPTRIRRASPGAVVS